LACRKRLRQQKKVLACAVANTLRFKSAGTATVYVADDGACWIRIGKPPSVDPPPKMTLTALRDFSGLFDGKGRLIETWKGLYSPPASESCPPR
jgi:hypothetical protein